LNGRPNPAASSTDTYPPRLLDILGQALQAVALEHHPRKSSGWKPQYSVVVLWRQQLNLNAFHSADPNHAR
jgi:hypothetical protein